MQQEKAEQLLFEIQDAIRSMPEPRDFSANPDRCVVWFGRALAVLAAWQPVRAAAFESEVNSYPSLHASGRSINFTPMRRKLVMILHQAEHSLRLRTAAPRSVGIGAGMVFEYFDELRKLIESARSDLFLVDPYLDAEFVSRYLGSVPTGTKVRMLARERINSLKPAVSAFATQSSLSIEVRTAHSFHDRYVFVDGQACYQSGASFKDGARKTPTVIVQITDAFPSVLATYEQMWTTATLV